MRYKIKNWNDFQHYKDRCPPWIKLHHSLLTNEVWVMGNDASRALIIASMLLAARNNDNDGTFNGDPEYIKRFAYLNSKPDFKPLIDYGFIELVQDASTALAECTTEKRREETEKRQSASALLASLGIVEPLLSDFIKLRKEKKAPITKTAMDGIQREADKAGYSLEDALKKCCQKGWAGFEADWVNKTPKQGSGFLTAQQQRDLNNKRSTEEFLQDSGRVFNHE